MARDGRAVQQPAAVGRPDVHARALADGLEPLQDRQVAWSAPRRMPSALTRRWNGAAGSEVGMELDEGSSRPGEPSSSRLSWGEEGGPRDLAGAGPAVFPL